LELKNRILLFDGAFGTMLQKRGMKTGEIPDMLNLTAPETVKEIYGEYVKAGADVITANTFSSNRYKLGERATPDETIGAAIRLAREAGAKTVALDISQIGVLLSPLGTLSFEDAYEMFKEQVLSGVKHGADLILIETMSDLLEAKAALLAAKENSSLPVFVTMTLDEDGRTFLGSDAKTIALTLSSLGADAVGLNCSLGPKQILPFVKTVCEYSRVPVIVQPNAGKPRFENGETVFDCTPQDFCREIEKMLDMGVGIIGGCCGTTPEYTRLLRRLADSRKPVPRKQKKVTAVTSAQNSVILENNIAVIGERINPTGKKRLKEALRSNDAEYILNEAMLQTEHGADILDVNAGLPEIDEKQVLTSLVREIQAVTPLPLQIDSSDPAAIESACRVYCGKPIINSVNGKKESLDAVLPIAKKYGAAVVGLTLDENGIPDTAEERFRIAERILDAARAYGIPDEDVLIDSLVLTASTNQKQVMETLKTVSLVRQRLSLHTVLGVSNVSFGLPEREKINSTFLAAAFGAGLTMPILNPMSGAYMDCVNAFRVLNGEDEGAADFISRYASLASQQAAKLPEGSDMTVEEIILSGRKQLMKQKTLELLESKNALEIIDGYFIPALDRVGEKYEKGEFFLPQLMASAEAAKVGFDVIKERCPSGDSGKGAIILATVEGDVHDIGKNIVRMLLENYGYRVIDLGKDVKSETVVGAVKQSGIRLVGLSALMTTTVKNMEKTIRAIHSEVPDCAVMVGGAVLNEEYARQVGADFYSKDAAGAAKIAEEFFKNI
jgi:5-methyltetrahydrofolate--homocysteine methyltransferase